MSDPRVFFAAERTLLAWIRSGLTIMGFGFVVARFDLFLHMMGMHQPQAQSLSSSPLHLSNVIGIALVLLGVVSMLVAALQHRLFVVSLPPADLPLTHNRRFPVMVAFGLVVLGLMLAAYLAVNALSAARLPVAPLMGAG